MYDCVSTSTSDLVISERVAVETVTRGCAVLIDTMLVTSAVIMITCVHR